MKKRFLFASLVAFVATFIGCSSLDDDDEANAVASWLSAHGMPANYEVKTLEISSVPVVSMQSERSDAPTSGYTYSTFGSAMGLTRDYYMDFAFNLTKGNKKFIAAFRKDTTTETSIRLFPLKYFYKDFKDSLPFNEDLKLEVSYKFDVCYKKSELDSIVDQKDSVWYEDIKEWKPTFTFDSTYTWNFKGDSVAMYLALPDTFTQMLRDTSLFGGRVQIRVSAPEAAHAFRFYGHGSASFTPSIRIRTGISDEGKDSSYYLTPFRSAFTAEGEQASETVLYGGTRDSLTIELDGAKIMDALAEFYGDEFPWNKGNGMDVRQAVVLAQFSVPKDDSNGESELGLPIQVVASSFDNAYDSTEKRITESYKLNYEAIKETGHPNLIFYDNSDSLTIQVTYGMRDFINRGSELENFKFMLRLGYPVLAPQDTVYGDYINSKGDTIYFFFDHFDFAKYDLAPALENGVNMKLWLLSKRGEED